MIGDRPSCDRVLLQGLGFTDRKSLSALHGWLCLKEREREKIKLYHIKSDSIRKRPRVEQKVPRILFEVVISKNRFSFFFYFFFFFISIFLTCHLCSSEFS